MTQREAEKIPPTTLVYCVDRDGTKRFGYIRPCSRTQRQLGFAWRNGTGNNWAFVNSFERFQIATESDEVMYVLENA